MKTIFTLVFTFMIVSLSAQNFNWTTQSSGTDATLNDVQFLDNMTGWAVGNRGTIVATVDGGNTWIAQTSGTDRKLRSVFFLDQDTGWIAGGESPLVVLYTVNGGADWEALSATAPDAAFLNEIQFSSSTHGYGITANDIYHTEDGGTTWLKGVFNSSVADNSPRVYDLHILSDTSALVSGSYKANSVSTRPGVFDNLTNYDGEWMRQGAGNFDTEDRLRAIYVTESMKGFAGGEKGKIYSMVAEGNTFPGIWELNFTTPSGGWIWSIDFFGNDYGVFNTSVEVNAQNVQLIYHSANGGDNWAAPDSIYGLLSAKLSVGDAQNVWIVGGTGKIYKGTPKSTGVASGQASAELTIMPNPFTSSILIESNDAYSGVQLKLFNYAGQEVKSVYVGEFQYSYDLGGLEHLESGVYFLRMKSADGILNATQKIVKY